MKRFFLEYFPAWLLLMVFGFIVIHAPLTVWVGVHAPQWALLVKGWKEAMTVVAVALLAVAMYRQRMLGTFIKQPLIALALAYVALHIFMIGVYPQGLTATVAGLLIDLRYVMYFVALYGFLWLYPQYRRSFIKIGVIGAVIVVGFGVLQLFLPKGILTLLGYGDSTIQPYLTVDKNPDYIRYNSTLRGPNPLGAYAVMVLATVVAFGLKRKRDNRSRVKPWALFGLFAAAVAVLWVSYSRSALIGAVVALVLVVGAVFGKKLPRRLWYAGGIALLMVAGLLFAVKDTTFMQNVILHNNPTTGASVDSNTAHADSLLQGLQRMAIQPLGSGIGSTGSASLFGNNGLIIENQYLMVAHEVGWLGLLLFAGLFYAVLRLLWCHRSDWLALGVFASGIGLAVIGLMLPVWADDTVSIVWWGLAAVSLCYEQHELTLETSAHKI